MFNDMLDFVSDNTEMVGDECEADIEAYADAILALSDALDDLESSSEEDLNGPYYADFIDAGDKLQSANFNMLRCIFSLM